MTSDVIAALAGDAVALAIALLGWFLHMRTCRSTIEMMEQENKRLIEALSRAVENGAARNKQPPGAGEWRRAP